MPWRCCKNQSNPALLIAFMQLASVSSNSWRKRAGTTSSTTRTGWWGARVTAVTRLSRRVERHGCDFCSADRQRASRPTRTLAATDLDFRGANGKQLVSSCRCEAATMKTVMKTASTADLLNACRLLCPRHQFLPLIIRHLLPQGRSSRKRPKRKMSDSKRR